MDSNSGKKVAAEALISRFEITKLLKQGKLSQHHNPPHNSSPYFTTSDNLDLVDN